MKVHPTYEQQTVADIDDPWLRSGKVGQWTGDLDGMLERGFIRILITFSRFHYFVDGAMARGIMAGYANALEEEINRGHQLADTVRVVILPVQPDELLPMLVEGYGDIAAASLTITPARQRIVDFAAPSISDVRELVVTGTGVNRLRLARASIRSTYELPMSTSKEEDLLEMVNAGLYPATVARERILESRPDMSQAGSRAKT